MPVYAPDTPAAPHPRQAAFDRFSRLVEWPVALLALAVVPALVLQNRTTSPELVAIATAVNWIVWIGFCAEYLVKLALAPRRAAFVKRAWFDLLIIVLSPPFLVPEHMQAARGLRAARLVRLLRLVRAFAVAGIGLRLLRRLLQHRRFEYVLAVAAGVVALGAIGIFAVESGHNPRIASIGDAFWWAVVTATTVGYGDVSPVTAEGRVLAVVLMITGIGVIGVFTATVASLFFEQDADQGTAHLEARLARVEDKLDRLLEELSAGPDAGAGKAVRK
jgi:voltage-gated potassium channel